MMVKSVVMAGIRWYNYHTQTETELHKMTTSKVAVATTERTTEELTEGLEKLRQIMIADYDRAGFKMGYDIEFEFGSKYIRVITNNGRGSRSCAGFVCCDRNHKKIEFGALLKNAGWKAPALNFARGSVFDLEGKIIAWTGIQ